MLTYFLANFFLLLNQWPVLLFIAVILMTVIDKAFFRSVTAICATSLVLNVTLKGIFKVPLSAGLVGYAFPSGHMQLATVFYLWVAVHVSSWWIKSLILGLLVGIGYAIIYFHYHHLVDIVAAVMVGLLLVISYFYCLHRTPYDSIFILWIANSLLLFSSSFLYSSIPSHAKIAYGIVSILFLIELLTRDKNTYDNRLPN